MAEPLLKLQNVTAGYGGLPFAANLGSVALYLGRFVPLVTALAVGGTLAGKKTHPESAGNAERQCLANHTNLVQPSLQQEIWQKRVGASAL